MMGMYFDTGVKMSDILFAGWDTNSNTDVVIASLISFLITILFEGLKTFKSFIILMRKKKPTFSGTSGIEIRESQTNLLASLDNPDPNQIRKWRAIIFLVESFIHVVSFFYGYLLMLIVMTYSVWFVLAVVIGSGFGYFMFHPISLHLQFKYSSRAKKDTTASCCSGKATPSINTEFEETSRLQSQQRSYNTISQEPN
ncbi:protein SLC31A2-like [Physella acuta]|uniref:protein SLC31A2-like n=1 Tax=Physella acuta TaxID=109671 RepID=UPI0027DDE087|nr:protein SLC31A2-like [Physella acuta]